ncbi:MAG: BamA/TamA family outer membrane protein [Acidobacteria bacterium]|nr:BamA/TamA family outer membrane protein [Acidobacteriota bacterium]
MSFAEFLRNIGKNIFVGPRFQYRKLTASFGGQQTTGGFEIPAIDLKSTTSAIGFHVQQDRRDSSFYPTKGWLWNAKADFFAKALGSNRTYQTYGADFNGYKAIGKGQVLAYRGSMCSVSDTAPFFDLCFYGSKSDLRGYTSGQFQNRRMFAVQAEYRRELFWRVGVVGFAGIGGVERNWSDFRLDGMLPAGGAGLRFRLDKKNKINYRIDWGYGRAGSHSVYVRERSVLAIKKAIRPKDTAPGCSNRGLRNQAEAILSADQCRNYQELTTRNKWLIAE